MPASACPSLPERLPCHTACQAAPARPCTLGPATCLPRPGLPLQVGPHAREAWQLVLALCKLHLRGLGWLGSRLAMESAPSAARAAAHCRALPLHTCCRCMHTRGTRGTRAHSTHLQLALARRRALAEDVQDQGGAVADAHLLAQRPLQVAQLACGRERRRRWWAAAHRGGHAHAAPEQSHIHPPAHSTGDPPGLSSSSKMTVVAPVLATAALISCTFAAANVRARVDLQRCGRGGSCVTADAPASRITPAAAGRGSAAQSGHSTEQSRHSAAGTSQSTARTSSSSWYVDPTTSSPAVSASRPSSSSDSCTP